MSQPHLYSFADAPESKLRSDIPTKKTPLVLPAYEVTDVETFSLIPSISVQERNCMLALNHDLLVQSPWNTNGSKRFILHDLLEKLEQLLFHMEKVVEPAVAGLEDGIKQELQILNGYFLYQPFEKHPYHYKVSGTDEVFENWSDGRDQQKKFRLLQNGDEFISTTPTDYDAWLDQKKSTPYNNPFSFAIIDPFTYVRHTATASRMLRYYLEQKWDLLTNDEQKKYFDFFSTHFHHGSLKQTYSRPERLLQYLLETYTRCSEADVDVDTKSHQQRMFGAWGSNSHLTKRTARLLVLWLFMRLQLKDESFKKNDQTQKGEIKKAFDLVQVTERIRKCILSPGTTFWMPEAKEATEDIVVAFRTSSYHEQFFSVVCRDFMHLQTSEKNYDEFVAVQCLRWFYFYYSDWNSQTVALDKSRDYHMLAKKLHTIAKNHVKPYRAFVDAALIHYMAQQTVDATVPYWILSKDDVYLQSISDEASSVPTTFSIQKHSSSKSSSTGTGPTMAMLIQLKQALAHPKTLQRKLAEQLYTFYSMSTGDAALKMDKAVRQWLKKVLPDPEEVPLEKWASWQQKWHVITTQPLGPKEIHVPFYTLAEFLDL